ncbi:hypothetical protein LWC33_24040 [Pseudonocardia sp. RS11V-5]|uniref:hypothetical protein n=1 Tax=Pseudonocardia terrae TaxID=2905831 RepID=UPI001E39F8BB|nr:hypothetical protein [Pseudonocardia terrae]MCE3554516.1 hypothetical protein [Pseudonocardia terrae]
MNEKTCANCGTTLGVPVTKKGGVRAVAWMNHCDECAEGVADQMVLAEEFTTVQIWRCDWCGLTRTCRNGWTTRCHSCLDDRTNLADLDLDGLAAEFEAQFPDYVPQARLWLESDTLDDAGVHEYLSAAAYEEELEFRAQPGWTVIAGDVKGLPYERWGTESHGFWGIHDKCGTVQNLSTRECRECEPEPGSRTHRARKDDPHLLYLVRNDGRLKIGHGDRNRILTHTRGGAEIVSVRKATFAETVKAEREILQRHKKLIRTRHKNLPPSFGSGTEVLPGDTDVDLAEFLPDAEDVTAYYELHALGVRAVADTTIGVAHSPSVLAH